MKTLLSTEQYEALATLAEELFGERGPWDEAHFLQEIDRRVAKGIMPPIFTASKKEAWERYRHEMIHHFFSRYEEEKFKNEKRWIMGVHNRTDRLTRYVLINGGTVDEDTKQAALQYYQQGLTLIARFYRAAGKTEADVEADMRGIVRELVPALS
jgi:hypothetical protein